MHQDNSEHRPRDHVADQTRARSNPSGRANQEDAAWLQRYGHRAGVEGTISQTSRAFGLRRSHYKGQAKTHLQHLLTAAGINLVRLDAWMTGTPLVGTRTSHFTALRPAG
ncbi:transposase [Streptomyces sp. 184]|uniref:transposase n=1 Tax=Streptomyces sp. 184 TaxID=1827526 RepID=UPI0038921711